jgi:hypothetical protein
MRTHDCPPHHWSRVSDEATVAPSGLIAVIDESEDLPNLRAARINCGHSTIYTEAAWNDPASVTQLCSTRAHRKRVIRVLRARAPSALTSS